MFTSTIVKPNILLIPSHLIEIKPLVPPSNIIDYVDFKYDNLLEIRKKKIDKILERIRNNG